MGRFFPGFRPAMAEQVKAARRAWYDLFRNSRYESRLRLADGRRAIREETSRDLDLTDRAWEAEQLLSRTQRWWHWNRALGQEDRDFGRMQRASDQQAHKRRRAGRPLRTRSQPDPATAAPGAQPRHAPSQRRPSRNPAAGPAPRCPAQDPPGEVVVSPYSQSRPGRTAPGPSPRRNPCP